jgi:hypothetical protein
LPTVLISVQLDDETVAEAAEVQDVPQQRILPSELDAECAVSQSLPQVALGIRLVAPQSTSELRR